MPVEPAAPVNGAGEAAMRNGRVVVGGNGAAGLAATPQGATSNKVRIVSWAARARREAGPIGWAAFLASSWTWCIGMFLPVLMVRDYGGWGWAVFALPNVFGAAAMGWVLRDRDASLSVQAAHLWACRWFSVVTVAFHAYFVVALVPRLIGDDFVLVAVALLPVVALVWGSGGKRATLAGSAALAVSILAILGYVALVGLNPLPVAQKPRTDLLWLAPVSIFGFFLSPYLDLTFHRARQASTRAGGRTAFGVGFGVFFLAMIGFTALYARPLIAALDGSERLSIRAEPFVAILAVHLAVQAAFTVVAHAQSLVDVEAGTRWRWLRSAAGGGVVVAFAVAMRWVVGHFPMYRGFAGQTLDSAELVYRLFMAFYGLIFPTYVWLFMVPSMRKRRPVAARPPRPATMVFFAAVVVLAAPGFWMGFIEGRMAWLLPAIGWVLISRVLLPKGPPIGSESAVGAG